MVVSLGAFVLFFTLGNLVSWGMAGMFMIRSPIWISAMLLLSPATSLVGLSLTLLVSLKAKTYMEAQQTSGMVVLPLVALMIVQMMGVLVFSTFYVVAFSALLLGVSCARIRISPKPTGNWRAPNS